MPTLKDLPWGKLAIEVFAIVFGILLALGVNQWRENRSRMQLASAMLVSVENEICQNRASVSEIIPYYESISDTLFYLISQASMNKPEEVNNVEIHVSSLPTFKGLDLPLVYSSAYEAVKTAEVFSVLEVELRVVLSATYQTQDKLDYYATEFLMEGLKGNLEKPVQYAAFFNTLENLGKSLVDGYDTALTKLRTWQSTNEESSCN